MRLANFVPFVITSCGLRGQSMKQLFTTALCGMALAALTAIDLSAQTPAGSAESHVAAARAAAYQPGQDFTWVFDQNCKPPAPRATQAAAPQGAVPAAPKVPPKSEWFQEPAKVFDNLYYVGSQLQSMWLV